MSATKEEGTGAKYGPELVDVDATPSGIWLLLLLLKVSVKTKF
jgi:hypothetical protein